MITKEQLAKWESEWFSNGRFLKVDLRDYLDEKINSHLSELQAGNRDRVADKFYEISKTHRLDPFGSLADAVLSVIIPGSSEEVERLKAELADLRASMPKFKLGDRVFMYSRVAGMILDGKIDKIGQVNFGARIYYRLAGYANEVEETLLHSSLDECRASIPVEHLKGEQ